jgi:hypothetical protein
LSKDYPWIAAAGKTLGTVSFLDWPTLWTTPHEC